MGGGGSKTTQTSSYTMSPEEKQVVQAGMNTYMPGGELKSPPKFDPSNPATMQAGTDRVAPHSGYTKNAFNYVENTSGTHQPWVNKSYAAVDNAMDDTGTKPMQASMGNGWNMQQGQNGQPGSASFGDFNQQSLSQFQNPYQQSVVDTTMGELQRQHQIQQLGVNDAASKAWAFGGSRHGVEAAEGTRGYYDVAAQTLANLNNQGFETARDQYNKSFDQGLGLLNYNAGAGSQSFQNMLQAAGMYSDLAAKEKAMKLQDINMWYDAGARYEDLEQQKIDAARGAQNEEFWGPMTVVQAMKGIVPQGTTTTNSRSRQSGGIGGAIGSAVSSFLPMMMSDERVKDNIKEEKADDALERIRSSIKPISYSYKKGYGDQGRRIGFTAQDAEKAGIRTGEVGGAKTVDMQSAIEHLMHAVVALGDRMDKKRGRA